MLQVLPGPTAGVDYSPPLLPLTPGSGLSPYICSVLVFLNLARIQIRVSSDPSRNFLRFAVPSFVRRLRHVHRPHNRAHHVALPCSRSGCYSLRFRGVNAHNPHGAVEVVRGRDFLSVRSTGKEIAKAFFVLAEHVGAHAVKLGSTGEGRSSEQRGAKTCEECTNRRQFGMCAHTVLYRYCLAMCSDILRCVFSNNSGTRHPQQISNETGFAGQWLGVLFNLTLEKRVIQLKGMLCY